MKINPEWKWLFSQKVIERGKDYFDDDRVQIIGEVDGYYFAQVGGRHDYITSVLIRDGSVEEVKCNCPYAQQGYNCKHEVAMILALKDHDGQKIPISIDYSKRLPLPGDFDHLDQEELLSLLNESGSDDIQKILRKGIIEVPEFRKFLIRELHPSLDNLKIDLSKNETVLQLINTIFSIIKEQVEIVNITEFEWAGPAYPAIAEKALSQYNTDLYTYTEQFMDFIKEIAVPEKRYQDIADFVSLLFNRFEFLPYEYDCHIEMGDMLDWATIFETAFKSALYQLPSEVQKEIFDSIRTVAQDDMSDPLKKLIGDLALRYLEKDEKEDFHVKLLIDTIKDLSDEKEKENAIKSAYALIEREYSPESAERFRDEFPDYIEFRMIRLQGLIEEHKFSEAVELIKYSRIIDSTSQKLSRDYSELLIKLYTHMGMKNTLRRELLYYFDHFTVEEIEYFELLKTVVNEDEWITIRGRAFKKVEKFFSNEEKMKFYIEEEMYDHIKNLILNDRFFKHYSQYEESLRYLFPDELKRELIKEIEFEAFTNRIGNIDYFTDLLDRMKWYPGGFDIAELTVQRVREKYKKDQKLIVELEKRGY